MAVTLTGTGGLFTRLGKLFGLAKTIRQHQQAIAPTAATSTSGVRTIYSVYASTTGTLPMATDLVSMVTNEDMIASASMSNINNIRSAAQRTVIEMVDADTKLPAMTLEDALRELAFQMNRDTNYVARSTYTVGTPSYAAANVGDFAIVVSLEATKIIKDQITFTTKITDFPCIRPETLTFRCMQDTKTGMTASGSEMFHVTGDRKYDNLDRRWKAGSGAMMPLAMTSAGVNGYGIMPPGQNLLHNSGFEVATSNMPERWETVTGTAGTHWLVSTSTKLRGASSLQFVGNGSTLASIRQKFSDFAGTAGRLKADTLYLISFWAINDGTTPAAGVVRVSIQDGSGSVLGSSMSAVAGFTSGFSGWTHVKTAVISPVNIPDTAYLVIEQTTALTNGRSVFIDEVTVTEMARLASGGPGVAIVAGDTDARRGDFGTVAITVNEAGEMNLELDRMFGLYESGIALPSSTGTAVTVADSLIS
jgi:hypothetical protein